jgi:mannose-6-phosphate isomerase-like protein (cupin superfamily)
MPKIGDKSFHTNIENLTLKNNNYRKVLFTSKYTQLVLMSIPPKQDIGMEIHKNHDQFIRVESGKGRMIIDGKSLIVKDGSAIVIGAGSKHNLINTGKEDLKLYTLYSPPEHKDGLIQKNKK